MAPSRLVQTKMLWLVTRPAVSARGGLPGRPRAASLRRTGPAELGRAASWLVLTSPGLAHCSACSRPGRRRRERAKGTLPELTSTAPRRAEETRRARTACPSVAVRSEGRGGGGGRNIDILGRDAVRWLRR